VIQPPAAADPAAAVPPGGGGVPLPHDVKTMAAKRAAGQPRRPAIRITTEGMSTFRQSGPLPDDDRAVGLCQWLTAES
jgi:hypothetical protein